MRIYPFEVPDGVHPMVPYLLGHGLTPEQINKILRTFDGLGIRFHDCEQREVTYSWAVSWPRDPGDRTPVEIGDTLDLVVSEKHGVRLTSGALPPGIRLDKARGKLIGTFTHGGLYSITVTIGPAIKYDTLGSPGGIEDAGQWIPIEQPRFVPDPAPIPENLDELSPQDLERLIVSAQNTQRAKLIREADRGN